MSDWSSDVCSSDLSIEHFAECVGAGRESIANAAQGVKIARILDEARRKLDATRAS